MNWKPRENWRKKQMKGSAVRPSQAVPLSRFGGLGGGTGGFGVVRRRVGVVGEGVHATCLMTSYCLHPSPTRAAYFLQINYSPWFHSSKLLWTLLQFHPNDFLHHSASFKGWGLSVKLGKHRAIWGQLGTALQAFTLNPCTRFPQIPLLEKSTLKG